MLITLEGIEGSGKTTQGKLLFNWLKDSGFSVFLTREPGGNELGKVLRDILLKKNHTGLTPACELFLYLADRAQHVSEVIKPALKRHDCVLVDRFTDSTLVYQGYGRGIDQEFLKRANEFAINGLKPDLTLVFDLDVSTGLKRARVRNAKKKQLEKEGRFEAEDIEFHKKIRHGYLELAAKEPERFSIIIADEIEEKVLKQVQKNVGILLQSIPRKR
jgi:dTMP kinase